MKIIKRSGAEAIFDANKIAQAVKKANDSVVEAERLSYHQIAHIVEKVEKQCLAVNRSLNVEEIQDLVENAIMREQAFSVARNYVRYRYERELARTHNTTDERIKSILECNNEEVKQENSNKNPTVNSVQRDYIAGEVNKDFTRRFLLPEDIVEAHDAGIIHFHDTDYYAQHMHNCCLINLEDMLQNGTVISETMLEKPKSFSTACNIATQAIAQVASSQYGGQSISLAHLAPFVQISREKFRRMVRKEMEEAGIPVTEEQINLIAEKRVKEEINRGVQVIQYQVITLMTTNGQAPFITVFMYIDEVPEGQTREDLVAIIEEMLHQRIRGVTDGETSVTEPSLSRNHTELMLKEFGADIRSTFEIGSSKATAIIRPCEELYGQEITVPGDISSAAYFIAAGLIVPDSEILVENVGINPTRAGILRVCEDMGGDITLLNERTEGGERIADVLVRTSKLHGTTIEGDIIPTLIDEIPVIAVMAAMAEGTTIIKDAAELKVKETDRIETVTDNLKAMGCDVTPTEDGMIINGGRPLHGASIHTLLDHRIAMAFSIAALVAEGTTKILDSKCVDVSYPTFYDTFEQLL